MSRGALTAIVLGAIVNLALASLCLWAARLAERAARNEPEVRAGFTRSSVRAVMIRSVYLRLAVAAVSLAFPTEMLTTPIGIAVSVGICGFLVVDAVVYISTPELRGDRMTRWLSVAGALCYAYALLQSRAI